ncbi:oxidoreductase [Frondihabitans sp. PAMC 28766]|uniref:oxidoreductase n=1 Tax=Frondihabitans sp. PAMC 28766 TaxID=1795630 RepID=UPI00078ED44D|nr:oxidoreductase [Frondihabitans sp. PAMC 28766]AMM19328.1 oxidoreductase [Frondihabitans sp. PAMC 28766]
MANTETTLPGGTFTMADDLTVTRLGYGAMQLAGPGVFGPPKDHDEALAVLRAVVEAGITHIDTADFYGPFVTNRLIKEALHPYPESLHIVTKIGSVRDDQGNWLHARSASQLREQIESNLENLGLDQIEVANVRVGGQDRPEEGSIASVFEGAAALQSEGLVKHLGLSTVNAAQIAEAQAIAPIVTVQNFYNIANREDDDLVDSLAAQGISYAPYFPLGGFSPLQSSTLSSVAERLGTRPMAVAVAWLLHRSPNILLIPGTSSVAHLRDNIAGAGLVLDDETLAQLNSL